MFLGVPHRSPSFNNLQDELARLIVTADPDSEPVPHSKVHSMASAVYAVNDAFPHTKALLWAYITNIYSNDSEASVRLFEPFTVTTETPQEWRYPHDGSHMRLPLVGDEQNFYENTFELCLRRASTEMRLQQATNQQLSLLYNRAAPIFPPGEYKSQDATLRWLVEHEKTKAFLQDNATSVLHVQGRVNAAEAADRLYRHIDSELVRMGMKPYLARFDFNRLDVRKCSIADMAASFLSQIALHQYQMDRDTINDFDPFDWPRACTQTDLWAAFDAIRVAVGKSWWGIFVIDGLDQCDEAGALFFLDELKRIMASSEQYFQVIITTTTGAAQDLTEELNLYPTIDLDDETREVFSFDTAVDFYYNRHLTEAVATQKHIPFCDDTIRDLLGTCGYDLRSGRQLIHWLRWSKATFTLKGMIDILEMVTSISDPDVLFRTIMDNIPARRRTWAKTVVKWTLYAFQPLRSQQLAAALAFAAGEEDPVNENSYFDDLELITDLRECFGSLLAMDYDEMRIGHPAAVSFLHKWLDDDWKPNSKQSRIHRELAELCIKYLELPKYRERLETGGKAVADVLTARGGTDIGDFFTYAVKYLPAHYGYAVGFEAAGGEEVGAPVTSDKALMGTASLALPPFLIAFYLKVLRELPDFFISLGVSKILMRTAPADHPFLTALFAVSEPADADMPASEGQQGQSMAGGKNASPRLQDTKRENRLSPKLTRPDSEQTDEGAVPDSAPEATVEDAPAQLDTSTLVPAGLLQLDIGALYGQAGLMEDAMQRLNPSDAAIMSALRHAATLGASPAIISKLTDAYSRATSPDWWAVVPARLAWLGYEEQLTQALRAGCPPDQRVIEADLPLTRTPLTKTPIYYAVARNHLEIVKMLLDVTPALTAEFVGGPSVLRVAVQMGYPEMVRFLLKWISEHPSEKDKDAEEEVVDGKKEATEEATQEAIDKKSDDRGAEDQKSGDQETPGKEAGNKEEAGKTAVQEEAADKPAANDQLAKETETDAEKVEQIYFGNERSDSQPNGQQSSKLTSKDEAETQKKDEESKGEEDPADEKKDDAAASEPEEAVEKEEDKEKDKETQQESHESPVALATVLGHHRVLSALLDAGQTVDSVTIAPENVDPPFIKAAINCRLKTMEILLDHGVPIDGPKAIKTGTALNSAAFVGQLKMCQLLIKRGANVNPADGCCPTVLHGVEGNDPEVVKLLLDHGADINGHRGKGTALLVASDRKRWEMAKLLIERGADVTAEQGNSPGCTALYYACTNRATEICRLLVEKDTEKVTINKSTGPRKWSNLHAAYDVPEIIDLLVENGADVECASEDGTAMYLATWYNCPDSISTLLKYKANMEKPFIQSGYADNQYTPLRAAISKSLGEAAGRLLEGGADINCKRETDLTTPLHDAVDRKDMDMLSLLLGYQPNLEAKEKDGRTALNCISDSTPVSVVRALVNRGADIESRADSGVTPLATAVTAPNLDVVTYLLSKKADLAVSVPRWGSPLHIACRRVDLPMVELLLKSGADVNFMDPEFPGSPMMSAIFYPEDESDEDIMAILKRLLEDERADMGARGGFYGTALHTAILTRGVDLAKFVLEHGGDVSVADDTGRHPLHHAGYRTVEHLELLLTQKGADINVKDLLGRSPLHTAVMSGRVELVERVLGLVGEDKVNDPDRDGWTPIMWAARVLTQWDTNPAGQADVVRLLLSKKADLFVTGEGLGRDWTPAEVARFSGASDEVVNLLAPKMKRGSIAGKERWSRRNTTSMRRGKVWEDGFCDACLLVRFLPLDGASKPLHPSVTSPRGF
jgi:ankyrin repeat protein